MLKYTAAAQENGKFAFLRIDECLGRVERDYIKMWSS